MTQLWISIFGYEYLESTTIVDIHNSVMETIMDITVQLWISIFANSNNLQYSYKYIKVIMCIHDFIITES